MNLNKLAFFLLVSCMPGERERSIRMVTEMVAPWEKKEWRKAGWQEHEFEVAKFKDIKFEINFARKPEDKFKNCEDYGLKSGCLFVVLAKVGRLKFAMARFSKEFEAKKVAFILREYFFDRWVMEGVAGEPILEDFVTEVFSARKIYKIP